MPRPLKIAVIGAGSGVFSLGLVKDLCLNDNLRESQVAFMDLNQERLEIVHRLAGRYAEELGSAMQFETTTDREAALRDADFVVNTASPVSHHVQRRERELADEHGYYYGGTNLHAPFAQFRAIIDATGVHPLKPTPLPRKIMLEVIFPFWLDMERGLEAYKTGDRSMLLWNVLQSHQTRSYEQAVEVLQALLSDPEHAALAARYQGFDGAGDRWKAPAATTAV